MKLCPQCSTRFEAPNWECPECRFAPHSADGFPILAPQLAQGGAGFKAEAFPELAALEAGNFWFRARNKLIVWAMQKFFPEMSRYLEIGCGTGYVLAGVDQSFPKARITGSEIFSVGLPFAAQRVARAELLQMDAREIPYVEEFDVIGAFDVLEHIHEDSTVLSRMFSSLRPGGGLVLTVPQHPWLWSIQDDYACHERRYRIGELRNKVTQAGFTVKLESYFVSLLLPAMFLSRLAQRNKTVDSTDPLAEMRIPRILNTLFESVMDLERALIRGGLRLPVGGSLLLVASKPLEKS